VKTPAFSNEFISSTLASCASTSLLSKRAEGLQSISGQLLQKNRTMLQMCRQLSFHITRIGTNPRSWSPLAETSQMQIATDNFDHVAARPTRCRVHRWLSAGVLRRFGAGKPQTLIWPHPPLMSRSTQLNPGPSGEDADMSANLAMSDHLLRAKLPRQAAWIRW